MAKRIRDVMTRDVEVLRPQETLREAAEKMLGQDVGPLPVCDGSRVVGLLTDRDIIVHTVALGLDPSTTPVTEAMRAGGGSCFDDDRAEDVLERMRRERASRFLVLDHDERLVGRVALGDLAGEA
jgi:CBS domain-containing protein